MRAGTTLLSLLIASVVGWGTFIFFFQAWPWKNGRLLFFGIVITCAFGALHVRDRFLRWYSDSDKDQIQANES